jgi:hypothetical protein
MNYLDRISKDIPIANFMKIYPVGPQLFNADRQTQTDGWMDGQTDGKTDRHDEANSLFSPF